MAVSFDNNSDSGSDSESDSHDDELEVIYDGDGGGGDSDGEGAYPCNQRMERVHPLNVDNIIDDTLDIKKDEDIGIAYKKNKNIRSNDVNKLENDKIIVEVEGKIEREKSKNIISMYFEGRWLNLSLREAVEEKDCDPLSSLDIQVLFERLLKPLLGIECPRTDSRLLYGMCSYVFNDPYMNMKIHIHKFTLRHTIQFILLLHSN